MSEKNRIVWLDIAKFIGIVAIVYGHTIQTGITNRYVYSFHVPLFFFLQGVSFSVSASEKKPFGVFVKKKALSLLLPYYCFAVLSTAAMFVVSCFITDSDLDFLKSTSELIINILMGDCEANRPLWFLPCSFVLSILSYVIIKVSNIFNNRKIKYIILAASVLLSCIALYVTEEYTGIRFLPWKLDGAIHMLSFFMIGYMLNTMGCFVKLFEIPTVFKVVACVLCIGSGAAIGVINDVANYRGNYYGNIGWLLISAIFTIIGICVLSMLIPNIDVLSKVGKRTLAILLTHKFPILACQKILPFTKKFIASENVIIGLLVTLASIIFCCIVEMVFKKSVECCTKYLDKRSKALKS